MFLNSTSVQDFPWESDNVMPVIRAATMITATQNAQKRKSFPKHYEKATFDVLIQSADLNPLGSRVQVCNFNCDEEWSDRKVGNL